MAGCHSSLGTLGTRVSGIMGCVGGQREGHCVTVGCGRNLGGIPLNSSPSTYGLQLFQWDDPTMHGRGVVR